MAETEQKTIEVALSEPITGHGGAVAKVILKVPRAGDYFTLGEPIAYARKGDGTMFAVENIDVVKGYIDRLLVQPDALVFDGISLKDALAIKEAVLGFFGTSRPK
ncbi:MAG: hypothetical protein ABSA90_11785 [Xanthobacteraceae bacterium]